MEYLTIGTAGHVDHGKTVLVKALTGVDTDRLQEEKERGISIDLGFAPFKLPGGRLAGVVDVPGHERFIHNMLAGAAGMDLVMLVVDASEGVMPQTREHLDILQILGVKNGIVVITKIDLVEEEWQELVQEEIKEELKGTFLEHAPVHAVSAITGRGIEELKVLIDNMTAELEARSATGPLRLPVDRSFSIAGFGTVVTGTLIQGSVRVGDTVAVVPPGVEARVRNIQVHEADVAQAQAGRRVALNLSGLEKSQILRGSVVSSPSCYRPTALIDVSVELLPRATRTVKNLDPVHFFLGTARTVARLLLLDCEDLRPGGRALVQCRLDRPLIAERGDPFVIRSYSPMTTIGGGRVLDPYPSRHRRFRVPVIERLQELQQDPTAGGDAVFMRRKLEDLVVADIPLLVKETRFDQAKINHILDELLNQRVVEKLGSAYILVTSLQNCVHLLVEELDRFHRQHPLSPGISRAQLRAVLPPAFSQREYVALLERLQSEEKILVKSDLVMMLQFEPTPSEQEKRYLKAMEDFYCAGWLQPPSIKEVLDKVGVDQRRSAELYDYLVSLGIIVKISDELYFHRDAYQAALELLRHHFKKNTTLTLAQFRDSSGSSRKFAQSLLEYFDQAKLTRRVEDHRVAFKLNVM